MTIEDAFGISLPEDAWQHVTTYGSVGRARCSDSPRPKA
jgi:acyl carrier protein